MMDDPNVNFYDVVEAAEKYFETHDKGKGSGWKGYQRWKAENESKYYPSGDRSNVDPNFAQNAFKKFLQNHELSKYKSGLANSWKDLGPYDANNITSHYSPGIGRVEALWVNPNNTQQIYMGSRSGGFWKTSNEGLSWKNTTDTLIASGVNTIAVSPTHPDSVLINVRNASNRTTHGIYRSTDGGDSWTITPFNPNNLGWGGLGTNDVIYKVVYHPRVPNLVFVGTSNGIFRSDDNLASWTSFFGNGTITDIEFHPTNDSIIYAYDFADGNYLQRSDDQGLSYSRTAQLLGNGGAQSYIAVSPVCDDCVYAASTDGLWKSVDKGSTFVSMNNPSQSCRGFAVSDLDTSNMLYGYVDLLASSDGGSNFNQVSWWNNSSPDATYVHADLRTAESVNGVYYIGTDGYLCKSSNNGQDWIRLNDGTGIRENYAVGLCQGNAFSHMAGSQDNGTSILVESGWIEWNGGDGMEAIIQPLNDQWMIGSWQFGRRNRTTDGGQSRNVLQGTGNAEWQAPMLLDPNRQMRVYHFDDQVHISDEFGDNFQPIGSPFIGQLRVGAIAENNSDILAVSRNSNIRLSTDAGKNFINIRSNLPNYSITDIAFDPNRDSTMIVTYNRHQNDGQKIYVSHDMGGSWTNITHNLGDMPIRSVVLDHSDSSYIYVGAEIGVYYKPMNGNTWKLYSSNLPNVTIRDLEIHYGSNLLKGASWGRGLWETNLVGRANYPCILKTSISDAPTLDEPKENVHQKVRSVISYPGNLTDVFVKWSVSKPTFDQTIQMNNVVDSTWESQTAIPNYAMDSVIFFKVFAVGSNGDTSETYRFMYTVRFNPNASLISNSFESEINVSPNPSSGEFNIDLGRVYGQFEIELTDLSGRLIERSTFSQAQSFMINIQKPSGMYLLNIKSGDKKASLRLMKK